MILACLALPAISAFAATDPIVGTWKRMEQYGTFEDVRTFRSDGTVTLQIMGSKAEGTWKKAGDRYVVEPGGSDDFTVIEDGVLETHDSDGLIARYTRVK